MSGPTVSFAKLSHFSRVVCSGANPVSDGFPTTEIAPGEIALDPCAKVNPANTIADKHNTPNLAVLFITDPLLR